MKTKTYGISGYIEYQALITVGSASIKIPFTGGSVTGYGISPAKFITSDLTVQRMIERSKMFLSGRIELLSTVGEDEVEDTMENEDEKEEQEETTSASSEEEKVNLTVVSVNDPDEAKTYLREHFGVAHQKLKTIEGIKKVAEANGIIFEGI